MASAPDRLTLVALGILAFTLKAVVHEAVGHGGAALIVGCVPHAVSSAWWDSECAGLADPDAAVRVVKAGGTLANLAVAGIAAGVLLWLRGRGHLGTGAFFVWLVFVTNLLSGGGYLMVDPLFGFGDWTAFLATVEYPALRWLLVGVGVMLSLCGLFVGRRLLLPWLGREPDTYRTRSRTLCLIPFLSGATVVPLSALLNPYDPIYAATSAMSTFGGCAWLVWIGLDPLRDPPPGPNAAVARSNAWIVAGAAAALLLFTVLGPSMTF